MGAAFLLPVRRVETLHPDPGRWYALDDAVDAVPLGEADLSEPLRPLGRQRRPRLAGREPARGCPAPGHPHPWPGKPECRGGRRDRLLRNGAEVPTLKSGWLLCISSSLVLAGLFVLAFRFPGALGGWLEPIMALLFPLLLLDGLFKGRHAFWTWLSLLAGLVLLYLWVPQTLASKGGLPFSLALLGTLLLSLWEATGLWLVAVGSRWAFRRSGALAATLVAALLLLAWETWGFHVYPWTWGAAFGSLPWTARAAAFLGTSGLSALVWGTGAWTAAALAGGGLLDGPWRVPVWPSGSSCWRVGPGACSPGIRCGSWTWP